MSRSAAKTGAGPTVMVAVEQQFPDGQRILDDRIAARILPFGARVFLRLLRSDRGRDWMVRTTEKSIPGIWSAMMCRKRYIDEKMGERAGQIEAVVNLGAGFDTRAFRLPFLAGRPVWEVDQPSTVRKKHARLLQLPDLDRGEVTFVPVDFDHENLAHALESHAYSFGLRTFFVMEGVTQYLAESGIRKTFELLARAAPGSLISFTYVLKDFIAGTDLYGLDALYGKWVIREKAWLHGMSPEEVGGFLAEYGWRVLEHVHYADLSERYVRPTGRMLASPLPVERMVHAEKV